MISTFDVPFNGPVYSVLIYMTTEDNFGQKVDSHKLKAEASGPKNSRCGA